MYHTVPTNDSSENESEIQNYERKIKSIRKYKTTINHVIKDVMTNNNLLPPYYKDEPKGIKCLQKDFLSGLPTLEKCINEESWKLINYQRFESEITCMKSSIGGKYFIIAEKR